MCPVPVDLVSIPPGIVRTKVETDGQSIAIDYDPRTISDESIRQVAARLMPEAQRRFDKCVMRLGGRACEACALKLERKAQRIQGVRRARATFIGGVMSVTFDNAQLSPEQVIEHVRRTGAPVTPFTVPRELPTWHRGMVAVSQRQHRSRLHRVDLYFHDRRLARATHRIGPRSGQPPFSPPPTSPVGYLQSRQAFNHYAIGLSMLIS